MQDCERVDWRDFERRQSDSGRWVGNPPIPIMYRHSLPPADEPQLSFSKDTLSADYEEFDTICHVTSLENAMQIFKADSFKLQKVSDNSVVTGCTFPLSGMTFQQPFHPANSARILWYGPWRKSNIGNPNVNVERYGNVVFSMKTLQGYEGMQRCSGDFNYYFIEEIKYQTSSACRILVTSETYSGLRVYDPTAFGGPWFVFERGNHYYRRNCTLEIMREGSSNLYRHAWWLNNHEISFSYCVYSRRGVKAVPPPYNLNMANVMNDYSMQTLRLLFCLESNPNERFTFSGYGFRPEANGKLYEGLNTLHRKANEDFIYDENALDLMPSFKDMFMNADRDVVNVYKRYLQYILSVGDVSIERVPEILGNYFKIL